MKHIVIILKLLTSRRSPLNFAEFGNLTLTLLKSLDVPTPSYVQVFICLPESLKANCINFLDTGARHFKCYIFFTASKGEHHAI